jgi:hypothetical protein
MNRTVKLAKQGVMVALVAVVAACVGAQVTVQQVRYPQVAVKPTPQIIFVDDNTKPCPAC